MSGSMDFFEEYNEREGTGYINDGFVEHPSAFWEDHKDLDEKSSITVADEGEEEGEEEKAPVITGEYEPLRMYLKEMGVIPLLKKEDEIEIAKKIEMGKKRL